MRVLFILDVCGLGRSFNNIDDIQVSKNENFYNTIQYCFTFPERLIIVQEHYTDNLEAALKAGKYSKYVLYDFECSC